MFSKRNVLFSSVFAFLLIPFLTSAATWCEKITDDMQLYDQGDNFVHSGNVMQHSIWVLRNVANWVKEKKAGKDVIWLEGIDIGKYKRILPLATFLHDIGKCGDNNYADCSSKGNHAEVGFKYLKESLNNKKSSYRSKNLEINEFDFTKLFEEFGLNRNDIKLSAIAIKMHYGLGDVMQGRRTENSIKEYLRQLKNAADEIGYTVSEELIKICILCSAADVKGFDPIAPFAEMFDVSISSLCPKWTADIGVAHRSGGDGWKNFHYETKGPKARAAILKHYNQHKKAYANDALMLQKSLGDLKEHLKQLKFKLEFLSNRLNHLKSQMGGV